MIDNNNNILKCDKKKTTQYAPVHRELIKA